MMIGVFTCLYLVVFARQFALQKLQEQTLKTSVMPTLTGDGATAGTGFVP